MCQKEKQNNAESNLFILIVERRIKYQDEDQLILNEIVRDYEYLAKRLLTIN